MSFPRFAAVLFPLFMWWVTRFRGARGGAAADALSGAALAAYAAQFDLARVA